jgi:tripartite-type tricarboxylate transporter receptor subunit TctC
MVTPQRAPKDDRRRPHLPVLAVLLAFARLTLAATGSAIAQGSVAQDSATAQDVRSVFSGKPLNMIVGLPPGGGADAYARLVQRHLAAHLPGAASIVVQNVPGAGSLKSLHYLDGLPADGTAIGTFSSGLLTEAITSPQRVKIDFRKYAWIGNVSPDVRVCYVRHGASVRTWQDLLARRQVVFAASARGTAGNVDTAMLRDLFGVKLKEVEGYAGSAAKRLAVERGEVDGDCGGFTSMPQDWLRDGKVDVVVRLSPVLLPGMNADVPYAGDLLKTARDRALYDFLMAPETLGRPFLVSGRVPAARVAALRQAFVAMLADPDFREDADRMSLTVAPMSGEEVARAVAALYATSPDLVARAKAITAE